MAKFKIINLNEKKITEICLPKVKNFLQEILRILFGKYELFDFQVKQKDVGHPDFLVKANNDELYIEWKNLGDALRASQIEWIYNHPNKKSIVIMRVE